MIFWNHNIHKNAGKLFYLNGINKISKFYLNQIKLESLVYTLNCDFITITHNHNALDELKHFWTTIFKSSQSNLSIKKVICFLVFFFFKYVTLLEYSMNGTFNLNLWGCFQAQTEQRIACTSFLYIYNGIGKKPQTRFLAAFPCFIMMYSIHNKVFGKLHPLQQTCWYK